MRNILITGASTGIGLAMAMELGKENQVFAGVRKEKDKDQFNGKPNIQAVTLDVVNVDHIADAVALLASKGGLDVLINNAGVGIVGPVFDLSVDDLEKQFNVNIFGTLRMINAFKDQLIAKKGHIINVSSLNGHAPSKFGAAYNMSKFAMEALSETLMLEVKKYEVKVSILNPGQYLTPIFDKMKEQIDHMTETTGYFKEEYDKISATFDPSKIGRDPEIIGKDVAKLINQEQPQKRLVSASDQEKMWMLSFMAKRLIDIVENNTGKTVEEMFALLNQ